MKTCSDCGMKFLGTSEEEFCSECTESKAEFLNAMIPIIEIERIIASLQETIELMEKVLNEYCSNPNYAIGVIEANKETMRKLKELLPSEASNPRNTPKP